jgi:hypothetical protein
MHSPRQPAGQIDSLIIFVFLSLFDEFRGKRCNLLCRRSGDGLGVKPFRATAKDA